jgi:hydroxyacylglutathione hydrolase
MPAMEKNEKALLVGLLIIILVVLLFFSKSFLTAKNEKNANTQKISLDETKKITPISDGDLAKMILAKKPLVILDVRDPESYKAEHIINSKNVSTQDLLNTLASLENGKTYIIIDYTGENSAINLPDKIKKLPDVYSLSGGFAAWKMNQNATISAGDLSSLSDQSKVSYIKNDDLKKMIDEDVPNLYIVDVQDNISYLNGHLKGATNIFLDDIEKRRKEIPLGKKVVVYGKDGLSGFQAGTRLFDLGTSNVFVLPDGLDAWKDKGFEVVK